MNTAKYFLMVCVLILAGFRLAETIREFSDTRTITVTKKVPNTETTELKGYHITKDHFEKASIKVQPVSFSDDLFLTGDKGNLVSAVLEICTCLCVVWFIFRANPGTVFSTKSYGIIYLAAVFYLFSVFGNSYGMQHTSEFWNNSYWHSNGGPVIHKGFFVVDDSNPSYSLIITASILFFYRYLVRDSQTMAAI